MAEAKRNAVITAVQHEDGVEFVVAGVGSIKAEYAKMSDGNRAYAMFHGIKQRGVDAAALSRDTTNGKAATPEDKFAAVKRVVEHLNSGAAEWNMGGGAGGGTSLTIEAIARVKGIPYEMAEASVESFAKAKYEGDTKKALAYLRTGERVMAAMDEIRKERATKPVIDADQALTELA